MNKISIIIILIILTSVVIPVSGEDGKDEMDQNKIYVDDIEGEGLGNPAEDFTSIQEAINFAEEEDMIYVYNGLYSENIKINKTISLYGENKSSTILIIKDNKTGFDINADSIIIKNFTIKNGEIGLLINSTNCKIEENNITENIYGLKIINGKDNLIANNKIQRNKYGLYISKDYPLQQNNNNIIKNNSFVNNFVNAFDKCNNNYEDNYWYNWIGNKYPIFRFFPYWIPGTIIKNFDWKPASEEK